MEKNLTIYNLCRAVPDTAQKAIKGGRLNGMTDINPMWRIQKLTEMFGPCGIGWKYVVTRREMFPGANDEISCFVDVDLFYKWEGEWSEAIPGTGGASYITKESRGLYTSDECYKMALTDALSVACEALGIGADVYWDGGRSKYSNKPLEEKKPERGKLITCEACDCLITPTKTRTGETWTPEAIAENSKKRFGQVLCPACQKQVAAAEKELEAAAAEMKKAVEGK